MRNTALCSVALLLFLTTARAQVRVRLAPNNYTLSGRLEVLYNGTWGTVCDSGFHDVDARVVCYMLGHGRVGKVIRNIHGAGSGPIWWYNVQCRGIETNIGDCQHRHNGWGGRYCHHSSDVSVSCVRDPVNVRLNGSHYRGQGRLEVYHNRTWGTVCDDYFNSASASVVCKMLGYSNVGYVIGNRYGAGSGPIWLDDVRCSGTESNLFNCSHRGWGQHNCGHDEDVWVLCYDEVRLVGAAGSRGRLEVYRNGIWGTVCDNGFTDATARVVCYSLGYGRVGRFIGNTYGAGRGRIWLDNVRCNGRELSVVNCPHNGWGNHSCQHSDDVSVSCIADSAEAVVLVGGGNPRVGRLEVFHAHQWGTVCDNGFTDAAARVVCYSLGFGYVGRKVNISLFGEGDGLIWLDRVNCNGNEQYISECSSHNNWRVSYCKHHQDVAVSCIDNPSTGNVTNSTTPATGVRLVGGSSSRGRLEVLHNGVWGTVCGDYFTYLEGRVVCKMLGFSSGFKIENINYTTSHGPIWLDDVRCSGTERDIAQCSHKGWGVHNCQHREDVAVSCARKIEVRLNGGVDPRQGRLEVFHSGVWATACAPIFNRAAARVVCNMLGFFGYNGNTIRNIYGYGTRRLSMKSVRCSGTEESIAECGYSDWDNSNCYSSYTRAVSCLTWPWAVALFGGGSPREGRLQLYRYYYTWGTVCDDGFTDAAARVVCYSLGFGYVGREMNITRYGVGTGEIWLDDIRCNGIERRISDCSNRGDGVHNCAHSEDVAVSCVVDPLSTSSVLSSRITSQMTSSTTTTVGSTTIHSTRDTTQANSTVVPCPREGNIALTGRRSSREGRLEICHNGIWGTVCDDGFTDAAARVVCYSLGFGYVGREVDVEIFGITKGQIWLDNIQCNGTERHISECTHSGWGVHNCGHSEDVAVSCVGDLLSTSSVLSSRITSQMTSSATMSVSSTTIQSTRHTTQSSSTVVPCPREGSIVLIGGRSSREGRLEICHTGIWGTVCDDSFNLEAARVVCFMLGYGYIGHVIGNHYGAGRGIIWLDEVQCSGTETNIGDCRHYGWGRHDCSHSEDVSISCVKEVRLVGASGSAGRLEVYRNGVWGTVCNKGFTDAAARVVCSMLGFGRFFGRVVANRYGTGSGRIWLDNVRCTGTESYIVECHHNGWGNHSCQHSDDVSVSCIADSAEAVALVGGGNPRVGRLEVFHAHQWGTVCDNGFTDAAARVVCYSLGFGYVGRKVSIGLYDKGDGLIWLDNINCTGTERYIGECSHGDWRVHRCRHHQDVAVSCTDNMPSVVNKTDSTTPATGVRLVGGSSSRGRLEVLHNGVWGTVCGDYFTATAIRVVCRMLGFWSGSKVENNYTISRGPIWLDDVRCSGTETDIAQCSHKGWGVHNCQHREDVAVSCASNIDVRLNGGVDPRQGRVEVFHRGVWATACASIFNQAAARVVCNMLGFGYVGKTVRNIYGSGTRRLSMKSVRCSGTEESFAECGYSDWDNISCYYSSYYPAVSCLTNGVVALFGGGSPREGRLEVYHNGTWGTVCDDGFNDAAARVVCYSLGFGYVGRETNINLYGSGTGQIWLDDAHCNGTERHIGECSHRGWGVHDCGHEEDVAVSCMVDPLSTSSVLSSRITSQMTSSTTMIVNTTTIQSTRHTTQSSSTVVPCPREGSIVLTGGKSSREGRLQVCHNGIWGTVCDDGFTDAAVRVVCYSLGFGYAGREVDVEVFGITEGQIWLDNIQCNGTERHISECSHSGWGVHNCVHKEDVAVSCIRDSSTTVVTSTSSISIGQTYAAMSTLHSTTSTQGSSDQFHSTSSATSKTTSHPTSISTTSVRSSINRAAPDTTQNSIDMTPIIIAAVVVGGLLLIIIVIVIAVRFPRLRRKPRRQERTEMALTPVTASASTNNYINDAFGEAAKNENPPVNDQASNYNTYSDIQPSSSPAGGSVGDGDKPFAKYDMLPRDQ